LATPSRSASKKNAAHFKVGDQVIYPGSGVARIASVKTQSFSEGGARVYYEVVNERSTVWVQADGDNATGLRPLTRRDELPRYRAVLRGRPATLNQDPRQRRVDTLNQLKRGTLQDICEVVRDLSARGWLKPLGEGDTTGLRRSRGGLCEEWAAAAGVSLEEATAEINALLLEARQTFRV
jgi:RNA polymerase-interacting CarD/CdnL/TRCF family regulator